MVNSMLAHQQQSVHKILPIWSFHGNETWCMIGYHAVSVIADAYLKGIKGFINNSSAIDNAEPILIMQNGLLIKKIPKENYQNLRSQCYYMLSDRINNHQMAIKTDNVSVQEAITEELEQITRHKSDEDVKLAITPKKNIKENLGRSPDYADTLMMRMWFELNQLQDDDEDDDFVQGEEEAIYSDIGI